MIFVLLIFSSFVHPAVDFSSCCLLLCIGALSSDVLDTLLDDEHLLSAVIYLRPSVDAALLLCVFVVPICLIRNFGHLLIIAQVLLYVNTSFFLYILLSRSLSAFNSPSYFSCTICLYMRTTSIDVLLSNTQIR